MKLAKRIRLFIAMYSLVFFGFGTIAFVHADPLPQPQTAQQSVCQTLDGTNDCSAKSPQGSVTIDGIIKTIVNIFSFVIGVVSVIMIMVGGFRYITSGGDSNKIASAKSTITYAIIGIVITVLAQGIVRFVLTKLK